MAEAEFPYKDVCHPLQHLSSDFRARSSQTGASLVSGWPRRKTKKNELLVFLVYRKYDNFNHQLLLVGELSSFLPFQLASSSLLGDVWYASLSLVP